MAIHSPARFSVRADPAHDAMYVDLSGFFLPTDVAAFDTAWWTARAQLRCAPNAHLTLCDLSGMSIQTQEVVNAFTEVVRHPDRLSRRMAMVVGASLSRHQAKRLPQPGRANVSFFFDRAEAEAWLFSDDRTDAQCLHAPALPMWGGRGYTDPSAA